MENAQLALHEIRPDFLLLENQLPFFIIKIIWSLATHDPESATCFCCLHFSHEIGLELDEEDANRLATRIDFPEHFVDLARKIHLPLEPQRGKKVETPRTPTATELHRAGIKFKAKSSKTILDISFSKGILKIPKWKVCDSAESIFRNLIAFEQCHFQSDKTYLCYYARLMSNLIHTPMDVDLLVDNGILDNWLDDNNDVLNMISKTGSGVMI